MGLDLIETLSSLIAIPSVNPMGRPASGPEFLEGRVTDYLEALFTRLKLPYQRQNVEPQRDNIVARVDGRVSPEKGGPLLLLEAHQDTVPVTGMTIPPWTPVVKDGRIYGRGSCDIKGGMAAMLCAVARLAEERPRGMPTIIMACTVNEEHGFTGATALARLWEQRGAIIPRRPDAAVIAEPTQLQVVVAHKGVVRWRLHTLGRAAHSSQPQLGDNAIFKMARVLAALEQYQNVVPRLNGHPLCGRPTLSVGTITGGISVNTVPDQCTIEIDRRLVPGEDPDKAYKDVIEFVGEHAGHDASIQHDPPIMVGGGLSDQFNGPLAGALAGVARVVIGRCEKIGVAFGTNAAATAAADVPSVVFGPGSIDQAHTADEWLPLDQLAQASEILYRFGRSGFPQAS